MSGWIGYFLRYYFDCRLRGARKPILGGFKVTHNCNMRCAHCPYWPKKTADRDFESVTGTVRELHDRGARILIFEGGEPFLWQDKAAGKRIHDVIAYARKLFFSVGVTTNGTFPIIDVPADVVWVSFDGMQKTYTRIRGDFFDRVVANLKNSNHGNTYANMTINRLNENELEEMVKFIAPLVKGITIQFHYPYGSEQDSELFIGLAERTRIIDRLLRLKQDGYPVTDSEGCLDDMRMNTWRCHDWMLTNADPDGRIAQGCYLRNRGEINCEHCGFAAHVEISKAFDLDIAAINVGRRIFRYRRIEA